MPILPATGVTITVASVIWLVLLITLGFFCLRKGHWVMFIIGLFIPLFWLIGAVVPRSRRYER
jgi:hypothetical protein